MRPRRRELNIPVDEESSQMIGAKFCVKENSSKVTFKPAHSDLNFETTAASADNLKILFCTDTIIVFDN